MKRCFFIGHRDASEDILPLLRTAIKKHIEEYGVTEFIVGNYGGFDRMAAKAIMTAKEQYPGIILTMLLAYHPAKRPVSPQKGFDGTFYPPGMEKVPPRLAIVRANRYMTDHTEYLIAYVRHTASNAANLVEYAKSRQAKNLIFLTLL